MLLSQENPSTDPHNQPINLHHKKMQKPINQKQPTLDQSEQANQPNHHQEIEQEWPENQEQSIVLIGDSVIKDIIPEKMSARKVQKFCHPGKTANEIPSDIQTINIRDSPSYVIIHAGTNNLPEQPSSACLEHLEKFRFNSKKQIWKCQNWDFRDYIARRYPPQ